MLPCLFLLSLLSLGPLSTTSGGLSFLLNLSLSLSAPPPLPFVSLFLPLSISFYVSLSLFSVYNFDSFHVSVSLPTTLPLSLLCPEALSLSLSCLCLPRLWLPSTLSPVYQPKDISMGQLHTLFSASPSLRLCWAVSMSLFVLTISQSLLSFPFSGQRCV